MILFIEELRDLWERLLNFLDISGDVWMSVFTGTIVIRLLAVLHGAPSITGPEASLYVSAIGMFGYSNIKGPRS